MGTRCITVLHEVSGEEIAVLYSQGDGYLEGHGQDLAQFLAPFTICNGITDNDKQYANGGGCLAAFIVANFKNRVGSFYLHAAGTRNVGEEFIYHVRPQASGGIRLTVLEGGVSFFGEDATPEADMVSLFDGPPAEFDPEAIYNEIAAARTA